MSIDPVTGGGTAERAVKIAQYLAREGVDSALLTLDLGLGEKLRRTLGRVELHALKTVVSRYYIPRISFKHIARVVAKADVVQLMNHWTILNAAVYGACRRQGKPYVVCPAGALSYYGRSLGLKRGYNFLVGNRIIKHAARHIAIPTEEALQFEPYGINPETVAVIPNGIDREDFKSRNDARFRRQHALGDHPFILFLGRLNSIKGPDLLLEAFSGLFKIFPTYHLVFAGPDGGMLQSLTAATQAFNIADRVHFVGYIGNEEKSQAYHAADLLVIPSRQEAMSIVALEAGITGTPVLMTDICGFDQVAAAGGGLIVKPSVTDIKRGLATLLSKPQDLNTRGEALKKLVLENYTWESIIQKYIHLFQEIAKTN